MNEKFSIMVNRPSEAVQWLGTATYPKKTKEPYPLISDDPAVQAHYEHCRREGTSHSLAEQFALGQGPSLRTDATYMQRHNGDDDKLNKNKFLGAFYKRKAKKAGVSLKGKRYLHALAKEPGDPEAWVSDRSDIRRVLESRGWGTEEGDVVRTKARELDKEPVAPRLADHIAEEKARKYIAQSPEPVKESFAEVKEMMIDKHGFPK